MSSDEINTNAKDNRRFGSWCFKATLKLSIVSVALFTILIYLGTWQMNRATYKKNITTIVQRKSQSLPVALSSLKDPNLQQDRFTTVAFAATFMNQFTFLLDNQMHQHKTGYRVITAAQILGSENWILIDRGWIASGNNRHDLPSIEPINGVKQLIGIINTIPSGLVLHKDKLSLTQAPPFVIQSLDYSLINKLLPQITFDFVVQLRSNSMTNYTIPELNFGNSVYKHWGYAVQWYLFAFLVVVYYLIATIKKES